MAERHALAPFCPTGHPFLLSLRARDRFLYVDRCGGSWHESVATEKFVSLALGCRCIFDVGAHIGWYTCLGAAAAPLTTVVAFEADRANANALRKNVRANGFRNVHVVNSAVCKDHGSCGFLVPGSTTLEHALGRPSPIGERIRTISIDGWCQDTGDRPDLVKIDVEGAELSVLQGMCTTLAARTASVLLEVHSQRLKDEARELLEANRYQVSSIRLDESRTLADWSNEILVAIPV